MPNGGTFYSWSSIEGSYIATISGNGPSATLTQAGSNSGYVTIQATFGDNFVKCGNNTLTKRVFVGAPALGYDINEDFTMCRDINTVENNSFEVSVTGQDANTIWEVQKITNNHNVSIQGNIVQVTLNYAPPYNYIAFKVRASNVCGFSQWLEYYVAVEDSCEGGGSESSYMAFPNPTSSELSIIERNDTDETITGLKLYDFSGYVLIERKDGSLNRMDVSRVKEGIYYLEITTNSRKEVHKIIVNK